MEIHDIICDSDGCSEHAMKHYRHDGPSMDEIRKACVVMGWVFHWHPQSQQDPNAYCPTCAKARPEGTGGEE